MKKNIALLLSAFACIFFQKVHGQIDTLYYLNSDFETLEDQLTWESDKELVEDHWYYYSGGEKSSPAIPASGLLNAHFNFSSPGKVIRRKLASSAIDLSQAGNPRLAFQYSLPEDIKGCKMYLLFQANSLAGWDTIRRFEDPFNPEDPEEWKEEIFNIDEIGSKYLTEEFRLAFLALNKGVNGVSVDSVVIQEKDTIPKFIKNLEYARVDQEIITSKAKQVPLIKVHIKISGNDGSSNLKNVSFKLNEGDEAFFKTNGFKLYHTIDEVYRHHVADTSTEVGSTSVSGGNITFSGINVPLTLGNNYLWLTADFAETIDYNSYFKIGVEAKTLQMNDSLYPKVNIEKVKDGRIKEAVFYDNFDADLGWVLQGDFERAEPVGFTGTVSSDANQSFSGTNILGTDLTVDGYYQSGVTAATGYYATTPVQNLKYYNKVRVSMQKWNDILTGDSATMAVSNDGGATWNVIWRSIYDPGDDNYWEELYFEEEVEELLSRKEQVQFRFGMNKTGPSPRFGFNIDQFVIAGNHLDTDVGITDILSPYDDCLGFNNDTVKIVVRNYADGDSPERIPVYFALWGKDSTVVRDTIVGPIAKNDSVVFKFTQLAGFPQGDIYDNFTVGIELPGDEDSSNDSLVKIFYIQDCHTPPAAEDFEYKGGVWKPDSDLQVWKCHEPGIFPLNEANSKSWVLYPDGLYAKSDERYITSACYDMTTDKGYILQMDYILQSFPGDGFAVQYSVDNGKTWELVDTSDIGVANNWGWYVDSVEALGHPGWSGTTGAWKTAKELLPPLLSSYNKVKFRIKWASNDDVDMGLGFAFDNFSIYPAPADMGLTGILKPDSACQFVNTDTVEVSLKNYGHNDIKAGDTLKIGVDFLGKQVANDTFIVKSDIIPGSTAIFKVPTDIDIDTPGTYSIKAYVMNDGGTDFYGTMNDTINHSFTIWQNPISGMPDTLASRQPDTLMIKLNEDPTYSYLWFDGKTTSTHDVKKSQFYYSVTISESDHGCQTKDSTYVELLFNDIGADTVVTPISDCELTGNEYVTIRVKNKGTDSLIVGDQIHIYYSIDGGALEHDSVTLTEPLMRGQTFDHKFNDPVDFSAERTYRIQASAYFGGDTIRTNDTIVNDIIVYGYPTVDLGPDSIVVEGLEHTLDPGEYSSYLWKPGGDTTRTLTVSESGTYTVQITDEHTCPAEDSIYVFLKITDVRPEIISPSTACDRSGDESVTLLIVNNGTGTIKTSDNITVSYLLDGGTKQEESVTIPKDIEPGGSMVHEFAKKEDIAEYRLYSIEVTATITGDMRPENDTVSKEFNTYKTPVVELGDSVQKVFGTEKVLEVEDDKDFTYAWTFNGNSFGSTNKVTATEGGVYKIVVSNDLSNGLCSARDSVDLAFDIDDFSLEEINLATNVCQSDTTTAVISVHNHSLEARENVKLMLGIQVGTGDAKVKEVTIEGIWAPTTTKDISFGETYNLESSLGTTNVRAYIDQDDARPENNEIVERVEVIEAAIVNFAGTVNDTLKVNEFPHLLDPGVPPAGNQFLWDDNVTVTPTFLAKTPGRYSVLVINQTGCRTFKEVWLEKASSMNQAARDNLTVVLKPNPAKDYLNIGATLKTGDEFIIEMFDISNRTVFSDKHSGIGTYNNELDVSNMSKGVYFIRVANKDIYFVNRVIIK